MADFLCCHGCRAGLAAIATCSSIRPSPKAETKVPVDVKRWMRSPPSSAGRDCSKASGQALPQSENCCTGTWCGGSAARLDAAQHAGRASPHTRMSPPRVAVMPRMLLNKPSPVPLPPHLPANCRWAGQAGSGQASMGRGLHRKRSALRQARTASVEAAALLAAIREARTVYMEAGGSAGKHWGRVSVSSAQQGVG